MAYDVEAIRQSILREWKGFDFFVLPYRTKRSGQNNEITDFILNFKNNWAPAVKIVVDIVGELLAENEAKLKRFKCQYVLAAPPSSKGTARPSSESLCRALANRFSWLTYLPAALERTESVQKSAYAQPGGRPGYQRHLETIKYIGPDLDM